MTRRFVFEGLKVADFSWVGVGPITTRYLADHGATVLRIESTGRPETLRRASPFQDNIEGVNRSGYFNNFNASKYSITLNMAHPHARDVALRICRWADVLTESFRPGVMEKWRLDYESVRTVKPDIIYFSTSMQGQTGPRAHMTGFGVQAASMAGITYVTGWPDRVPAGPYGAYTDTINPHLAAAAIAAALDYRRRTGQGQHLDLSQYEGALLFLAPLLMQYAVNGTVAERAANRSPCAAPHGAYPCAGEDRWCAIAVRTDEEWSAFRRVLGDPPWTREERFATPEARLRHTDELDTLIGAWTSQHPVREVMRRMQEAGVPAGAALDGRDLLEDPQLAHRRHFARPEHPEIGPHSIDALAHRMSKSPPRVRMPAPCLGEHNATVYTGILGFSDEEFAELVTEGVID